MTQSIPFMFACRTYAMHNKHLFLSAFELSKDNGDVDVKSNYAITEDSHKITSEYW